MKFVTDLLKITRIPKRIDLHDGTTQYSKNIGVAPDGTLRPMKPTKESRLERR